MGFIMKQGPGTEQVIGQLKKLLVDDRDNTAMERGWFSASGPGNGSLLAAAEHFGIMPSAANHPNKWRKWLRWLEKKHKAVHDELRDLIHDNLCASPVRATTCDWEEDASSSKPTLSKRHLSGPNQPAEDFVTVRTKKADDLPDDSGPSKKKAAKKKAKKAAKKKAGKKAGKKKAAKKKSGKKAAKKKAGKKAARRRR
jgi:hypothetical protein